VTTAAHAQVRTLPSAMATTPRSTTTRRRATTGVGMASVDEVGVRRKLAWHPWWRAVAPRCTPGYARAV